MSMGAFMIGRQLRGMGGADSSFGLWQEIAGGFATGVLGPLALVMAPVLAPVAAVGAGVSYLSSGSSAAPKDPGSPTSLAGDYNGSGGYTYRIDANGNITILSSPKGGRQIMVQAGTSQYAAIRAELVRLNAAGGRLPVGTLGGGGGYPVLPSSGTGYVAPGAGVYSPAPYQSGGAVTDTGVSGGSAGSSITPGKILVVGGGLAVAIGVMAWALSGKQTRGRQSAASARLSRQGGM